jgi:hypothetical protein
VAKHPSDPHTLPLQFGMHWTSLHFHSGPVMSQTSPTSQVPQAPPQPSYPHSLPLHVGVQQPPATQIWFAAQQLLPQANPPGQEGMHWPSAVHAYPGGQLPQVPGPGHPSGPHFFPRHIGWQTHLPWVLQ